MLNFRGQCFCINTYTTLIQYAAGWTDGLVIILANKNPDEKVFN
jgi:hypothetical protein